MHLFETYFCYYFVETRTPAIKIQALNTTGPTGDLTQDGDPIVDYQYLLTMKADVTDTVFREFLMILGGSHIKELLFEIPQTPPQAVVTGKTTNRLGLAVIPIVSFASKQQLPVMGNGKQTTAALE